MNEKSHKQAALDVFIAKKIEIDFLLKRFGTPSDDPFYYAHDGVDCSMRRSGNVWDNAAMDSFFSSLKTERIGKKSTRAGMPRGLMCSIRSSAFTTRFDVTRSSAISALLSARGR